MSAIEQSPGDDKEPLLEDAESGAAAPRDLSRGVSEQGRNIRGKISPADIRSHRIAVLSVAVVVLFGFIAVCIASQSTVKQRTEGNTRKPTSLMSWNWNSWSAFQSSAIAAKATTESAARTVLNKVVNETEIELNKLEKELLNRTVFSDGFETASNVAGFGGITNLSTTPTTSSNNVIALDIPLFSSSASINTHISVDANYSNSTSTSASGNASATSSASLIASPKSITSAAVSTTIGIGSSASTSTSTSTNTLTTTVFSKRSEVHHHCESTESNLTDNERLVRLGPTEYKEQDDAQIHACGDVKLYVLGSSNVVWMTWMDQLHYYLKRLGFQVPLMATNLESDPRRLQTCDDSQYHAHLRTAHLGKVGWASWDFTVDDWEGCDTQGFRSVAGHSIKCGHGVGCEGGRDPLLRLSDIAEDAARSDVAIISTWFNDHKQALTNPPFKCFDGEDIKEENTSFVAIPNILKTVRAIHKKSNTTWVVVMAEYPMTFGYKVMDASVDWVRRLNDRVRRALADEPRTLFVDYHIPAFGVEMYQTANYGHPNCRGSKIMAHAIIDTLYKNKILSRSMRLAGSDASLATSHCSELHGPSCRASSLCWVDPQDSKCKPYGPGSKKWTLTF